jgi:hypothetical protein
LLKLECFNIITAFYNGELVLSKVLTPQSRLAGAFKRLQITNKGLKYRLVFAITYTIVCIEKYYDIKWKAIIKPNGGIAVGLTQLEISSNVQRFKPYYTYSFDATAFDHSIPQVLMVLSYTVLSKAFALSPYQVRTLNYLRNVMLTLPLFHPQIELTERKRGLNSGSGLTNTVGSIAMYVMHAMALKRYCRMNNINCNVIGIILVSSDDSLIGCRCKINTDAYIKLFAYMFGVTLELEASTPPGKCNAVFLGSNWTDGQPTRSINRMFGRICFGSGDFPKMSKREIFSSRCFEILGNDSRFHSIWKSFNLEMPNRIFRFIEVADYNAQLLIRSRIEQSSSSENRGIWMDISPYKAAGLAGVWMTR